MYTVKVFDPGAAKPGWRDIDFIVDDYHGYSHAWSDSARQFESLVEAFEVADGLWFHGCCQVRTGIVDARGELVYDAQFPVDLRTHPDFQVLPEPAWVAEFCSAMQSQVPGADLRLVRMRAKSLFPANRHSDPWEVMWAVVLMQTLPLEWPLRRPSLVQQGCEPGT
jgi:hypothetical protein